MTRVPGSRYSLHMLRTVALLALLAGCHLDTEGTSEVTCSPSAPLYAHHDSRPWLDVGFPIRVHAGDNLAMLEAVWTVNEAAGSELLRVTDVDNADVLVGGEPPAGLDAQTVCWESYCTITQREVPSEALAVAWSTHELLHLLGYESVTGDVHDTKGLMAPTTEDMPMDARAVLHLRSLVAK